MHTIKKLLTRYTNFLWALLSPLGVWGVFAIAAIDSALLGMPLDAVVGGYIYAKPQLFFLYVIMASAGSALGSIVIYVIGYKGGEVLIEKRMGKERFDRMRARFEKQEFVAVMIPAMLPPPAPFKLVVLSAAVLEMKLSRFLLAIFAGRLVRFLILAVLVLYLGPSAVNLIGTMITRHLGLSIVLAAAVGTGIVWLIWSRRGRREAQAE